MFLTKYSIELYSSYSELLNLFAYFCGFSRLRILSAGKARLYLRYGVFLLFIDLNSRDIMVHGTVGKRFAVYARAVNCVSLKYRTMFLEFFSFSIVFGMIFQTKRFSSKTGHFRQLYLIVFSFRKMTAFAAFQSLVISQILSFI